MASNVCRLCGSDLSRTFVDLGMSPPCETYLVADQLDEPETFYPLHVRVCSTCLLVQLPAYIPAEDIFSHYAYFSSSQRLLGGARGALRRATRSRDSGSATTRSSWRWPATTATSCSTRSSAASARSASSRPRTSPRPPVRGVPTEVLFLGEEIGADGRRASTAPRTSWWPTTSSPTCRTSWTSPRACAPWSPTTGTCRIEIPHLLRLIERNEYDTIYHEHYSYLSLLTTQRVLATGGPRSSTWRSCRPTAVRCGPGPARPTWPRPPARP